MPPDEADPIALRLPSDKYRPGEVWPEGFVLQPGDDHASASTRALEELAARLSVEGLGRTISVCLSHFRHKQMLAHNLHGFFVREFGEDEEPLDPFAVGAELRYGIVLNLPVELQRETALTFLNQLMYRQRRLAELEATGGSVHQIDLETARLDTTAVSEIADRLRYGWQAACEAVRLRCEEAGFGLQVRYEPDPVPSRDQIVRRMPYLRRIYNELAPVRESIDKIVSLIGGTEPRLVVVGLPLAARERLQQHAALSNVRRYMNQATRDSLVVGNGYLAFRQDEPFAAYNLRPDHVLFVDGRFQLVQGNAVEPIEDHVAHLRGIDQTRSPYGLSLLEVFIESLQEMDVFTHAKRDAETILEHPSAAAPAREWAERTLQLVARMAKSIEERVQGLLFLPERLPAPRKGLYFPEQELL